MTISLPLASESIRCVDFAMANSIDPGGTALAPDVVVLAEVDEPWPKPAGKHEALVELVRACQERSENIRLLAAVPRGDEPRRVIAFRPVDGGATRSERLMCADPVSALGEVLDDADPDNVRVHAGVTSLLVCTQGSHDVCCGTDGVAFADWADRNLSVEVFRVSHTGGHKFAPTAMTLPDGRMWAYLDPPSATEIVEDRGEATLVVGQCRGWWGTPTGVAQVGERAVFAKLGFDLDTQPRTVVVEEPDPGSDVRRVLVTVGEQSPETYELTVSPGREVPTIMCNAPGGVPVKPGQEWVVTAGPTVLAG